MSLEIHAIIIIITIFFSFCFEYKSSSIINIMHMILYIWRLNSIGTVLNLVIIIIIIIATKNVYQSS